MLVSFYVSFKESSLWKTHKLDYLAVVIFFTVVSSFLSTIFPPLQIPVGYPLGMLSFPFFTRIYIRDPLFEPWKPPLNIQFLTVNILSFSPLSTWSIFVTVFPFYMTVNFMGVILGYWMSKRLVDEPLKRELVDFFFRKGLLASSLALVIIESIFVLIVKEGTGLWIYIHFFSVYLFWVPALIATAIYGLKRMKE